MLKFFPAEPMGGVKFLQAICAPYKNVRVHPHRRDRYEKTHRPPQGVAGGGGGGREWLEAGVFKKGSLLSEEAGGEAESYAEEREGSEGAV